MGIVIRLDKTKPIYLAEKPILRPSPLAQNSISKCPTECLTELDLINELTTIQKLPNLQFFVLLDKNLICDLNLHFLLKFEIFINNAKKEGHNSDEFREDFNINKKSDS